MNAITGISLLYGTMSIGFMTILYSSFKNKFDFSSRFFLTAEFLLLLTAIYLSLISIYPNLKQSNIFFIGNLIYLSAEVSIAYGIRSLTHKPSIKIYSLLIFGVAIFCFFLEIMRNVDATLPLIIAPLLYITLLVLTLRVCSRVDDVTLKHNRFFKWLLQAEFALTILAAIRIVAFFNDISSSPGQSDFHGTLIFAAYTAINLFRYISYQSLRMTWVNPNLLPNKLNSQISATTKKNNLLIEKLINSNRLLGVNALSSSIAHQLSQPLTGIALLIDSTKRDLINTKENLNAVEKLSTISEQVNKLSQLVINLRRLFARQDVIFSKISLQEVSDEVIELIKPILQSQSIELIKTCDANPLILGNTIQLQQALINLLNNSIDALKESNRSDKRIIIKIYQSNTDALVSIEDNGTGIKPEVIPTLFELYESTKDGGLGVGLWLSKTIIEKHQGYITALNNSGKGAVFKIHIPLACS